MSSERLKIVVIGAGVAGLTAAWLLQRRHHVTLLEKNNYAGGHTHTVIIPEGPDAGTPVDTGFIVLNDRNYPLLHRLLADLGCPTRWSNMSFSYWDKGSGLQYAGTSLNGLFAQRVNLFRPAFYSLLREIVRFCRLARRALHGATLGPLTLQQFLERERISPAAARDYIVPMSAAIWSAPQEDMHRFPARTLLRFWENHGLLSLENRPRWQTIVGGSHSYVNAMLLNFRGRVRLNSRLRCVRRTPQGAEVEFEDGSRETFDRVVLAAHADESLKLLDDPSPTESRLLGAWQYRRNQTILHTDTSLLPPLRRAWASWNYLREPGASATAPVTVTYWMNLLQGLRTRRTYCVTLNPHRPIDDRHVIRALAYDHPVYSPEAVAIQAELPTLNGPRNRYFCGSYFGYGFHEDAVRSGVAAANLLGIDFP